MARLKGTIATVREVVQMQSITALRFNLFKRFLSVFVFNACHGPVGL